MPIIDVHAHWGRWPFAITLQSTEDLLSLLDKHDIERCCLSSAEAVMCNFIEGNGRLAEVLAGQPRLLGYVTLNPNYVEESIEEMRKYLTKANFVGSKFHPHYCGQPINTPAAKECLTALRRYGKPVLCHTWGAAGGAELAEAAKGFDTLKFIMGHMGGPDWQRCVDLTEDLLNVYVEPCSSFPEHDKVGYAVGKLGERRVLFGSDLTLINPALVIGCVQDANLTERQRQRVFYANAKELFDLP